ncbi:MULTISPECIES: chemotaxis protein CheB [unclassified Saccharicrinis]|uniref:chemotaxis protein CheB n=1 Tax=unclassified Saccharicrinis TaxID=2646859 RepID=UPI003D34B9B3
MTKKTTNQQQKGQANKKAGSKSKTVDEKPFPVVGLGASAGGLNALKSFFSNVSEKSGMAYIVVVHMSPTKPSMLSGLLQYVTPVPVQEARDGLLVEPNHIYVISPGKDISLFNNKIHLLDIVSKHIIHPIDHFFKSLALDKGCYSAAVVLSGTGTDGTLGLKEIKANEGLVLVQNRESAEHDGMPVSAFDTGITDMVLKPEEMPGKLVEYFSKPQESTGSIEPMDKVHQKWLDKIFSILRTRVGMDFSTYKQNTLIRRINRRMSLNQIRSHENYVRFLRENSTEIDALFRELLIGVTSFFRDAGSYDALKDKVLPDIIGGIGNDATFRVWIPGCSTGEEVYSLAIILHEFLENIPKNIELQLFGTDIDEFAIKKAREGTYPLSIATEMSKERLDQYFIKEGEYYRIGKVIRECTIFSVQNIIKDPPFSHLNMLCCRNLLIYLNTETQKKLMPLFHHTLNPNGILMLGSSETIGGFGYLFKVMDKKWKIFKRKEISSAQRQIIDFPSGGISDGAIQRKVSSTRVKPNINYSQLTKKLLLDQFSPTAILIDDKGEIIHVQGRTGKYLETPGGPPTHNILNLAREGLKIELFTALRASKTSGKQETRKRIPVKTDGGVQIIDLHICPMKAPNELTGYFLVVLNDIEIKSTPVDSKKDSKEFSSKDSSRIAELEAELLNTRENHQATIEELESSNEELKSTNEELQSTNEELQSTNEELESSKEELQSLNEELQTVNSELQGKLEELSAAHDDMHNLLNSTKIATIFVDNQLNLRRFTSEARSIINLIPTDNGRPLNHVVSNLVYDKLITDCEDVLKSLIPKDVEVQTNNGEWYKMRILPFRTIDDRIDGLVLTFSSIDLQKKAQEVIITHAMDLTRLIFDMNNEPMAVLDKDGNMVIANTAMSSAIEVIQKTVTGTNIFSALGIKTGDSELKSKLDNALKKAEGFSIGDFVFANQKEKQHYILEASTINVEPDFPYRILLRFIRQE